ncbi:MAG: hypothetical protein ACRBHB_25220 [Arenicella sp.]
MNKIIKVCLLMTVFFGSSISYGQQWQSPQHSSDWGALFGGMLTTLLIHEGAHYAMAEYYGFDVDLDGVSIVYPGWEPTDSQKVRVASAGFQSQWLASELAFNRIQATEYRQFSQGVIAGHIVISLAYLTVLKDEETSDIYSISEATGRSRAELAWALMMPAVLDTMRLTMQSPPKWLKHVSIASKGLGIAASWSF